MSSEEQANSDTKNRGKGKVFGAPSAGDRTLEPFSEYVGSEGGQTVPASVASNPPVAGSAGEGEQLIQEWDIEEPLDTDALSGDDILARLDRLEKRLDSFENTCYTFLLYAKQLTDRTVSFFEDIFGLSGGDLTQIHDRLGVNYNNKGDYPKAIEAFKKLVDLNQTPASCYKLGVAYDNNGDFQEAIEAYRRSLSLDAGYLKAYYKLAEVYSRTENFGEAIRCLNQAVEVQEDNPDSHFRLGSVHSARGSYDEAITSFNKVLSLDNAYPGIYQSLGIAYEQKGEHNRAIEFFKKSI